MTMPTITGPELKLDQEALNNPVSLKEQTGAQVSIWGLNTSNRQSQYGDLNNNELIPLLIDPQVGSPQFYRKVRVMRKHPTVRLVRVLSIASMAAAKWSVTTTDKADESAKALINTLLPMQTHIMNSGLRGMFDFGWAPYEKVWKFNKETCQIELRKLKALLQDQTQIMVERKSGDWAGFKQFACPFLGVSNAMLLNQDVEGTYYYGESTMSAIEFAFNRWIVTDESNVRYDKKISGAHWIIHYPEGMSIYGGIKLDNLTIANMLLDALNGSGSFCIPRTVLASVSDLNEAAGQESAWLIELKEASGGAQMAFEARLRYLDNQIVRAAEFPERAILEGQYGTKADAEQHADFAVARMDFRNKQLIEQVNEQLVNHMLRLNFGETAENSVKIEIAPIADDKKALLKQVYLGALSNPQQAGTEYLNIDMEAIRESIGIPTLAKHEQGVMEDDGNYTNLHQMLANLNLNSQVIGSDTGAAAPAQQQQMGA